jgi:hypothetical protein
MAVSGFLLRLACWQEAYMKEEEGSLIQVKSVLFVPIIKTAILAEVKDECMTLK